VTPPPPRQQAGQVLDRLVAADRIRLQRPPLPRHPKEIAAALMTADAYLAEGSRPSPLPAARLGNLYTACVDAANSLVETYGYVSRDKGGHGNVLLAAGAVLGIVDPPAASLVAEVRNWMRPLRHAGTYENLSAVAEDDVGRAWHITRSLVDAVRVQVCDTLGIDVADTRWSDPGG
jgi:hypothetical protein